MSRKERSNQRRQKLSEHASTSPHVSNFTNAAIETTESQYEQVNQTEKAQRAPQSRVRAAQLHLKQTVSSMQKSKQTKRSTSSQLSFKSSNQKQTSTREVSVGATSGGISQRLAKSKDRISSRSQASQNSKEKNCRESINSQTDRGAVGTSPLTPLLDNIIVRRSKQGSHDQNAHVSIFHGNPKDYKQPQSSRY